MNNSFLKPFGGAEQGRNPHRSKGVTVNRSVRAWLVRGGCLLSGMAAPTGVSKSEHSKEGIPTGRGWRRPGTEFRSPSRATRISTWAVAQHRVSESKQDIPSETGQDGLTQMWRYEQLERE